MTRQERGDDAQVQAGGTTGPVSVDQFLRAILRSRLIDDETLRQILRQAPAQVQDDASALADYLVKNGKLSRYQSRKLLRGHALGLMLGKYQVLAPIGKGGMGTVFLARDGPNGPLIALKILPPSIARSKQRALARFLREMQMNKQVRHPHLAATYEAGEIEGVYFLAMEFIPGKNLSRLVKNDGPLTVPRAARLIAEAAEGLHAAHENGIIHRDLKPSNIMVTPHDRARVLDLGLALIEGEVVVDHTVVGGQGVVVGTMDWIAPEQIRNAAGVDRRADVYSLGCTLYFALTGRPPFPGGDSKDKMRKHRLETPTPLRELRPDVPAEFAALVERMMAKNPSERYPTAQAVAEALRPWIGADTPLPVEQQGDSGYRAAVAAVAAADPSSTDMSGDADLQEAELPWPLEPTDRARQSIFWIAVALTLALVSLLAIGFLMAWLAG